MSISCLEVCTGTSLDVAKCRFRKYVSPYSIAKPRLFKRIDCETNKTSDIKKGLCRFLRARLLLEHFLEPPRESFRKLHYTVGGTQTIGRHGLVRICEDLDRYGFKSSFSTTDTYILYVRVGMHIHFLLLLVRRPECRPGRLFGPRQECSVRLHASERKNDVKKDGACV